MVVVFFLYDFDTYRGFRMLSPVLFFSMTSYLLSKYNQSTIKFTRAAIVIIWAVMLVLAIPQRQELVKGFISRRLEPVNKSQVLKWVSFNPDAKDGWENTVYIDFLTFTKMDFAYFEPGLGTMLYRQDELDDIPYSAIAETLKAKYLISSFEVDMPSYEFVGEDMGIILYEKVIQ